MHGTCTIFDVFDVNNLDWFLNMIRLKIHRLGNKVLTPSINIYI